ncbi:MAG: hypothetical protein HY530_00690 [Chloroflexi bacterium]|nr:hypothetical protein [Chloroflexota bacterium]
MKVKLLIAINLLPMLWLGTGCVPARDFDGQLRPIIGPHLLSIAWWQSRAAVEEARQIFTRGEEVSGEAALVVEYFSLVGQAKALKSEIKIASGGDGQAGLAALEAELREAEGRRAAMVKAVEKIIKKQIREALAEQGIFHPLDRYIGLKISFPPMNLKLAEPPYLLVVSPRDRIARIKEVHLKPDTSLEDIENIEAGVDGLGVSSLAVRLGGMASYPSLVAYDASLRFVIDAAAHEWLHQYLAFKPLGFLYVLDLTGVARNYDIATMNETLAGIVGNEIGAMVYEQYYSRHKDSEARATRPAFDFNLEMREIREMVDQYLARGDTEQAEAFMEQKRQYLALKGYHIRKLNQAYFAFYGTYADSPTSVSPIGADMMKLRKQSASLKDFLDTVSAMTGRQQLADALGRAQAGSR